MKRAEMRRMMRETTGWRGQKAKRRKPANPEMLAAVHQAVTERADRIGTLLGKPAQSGKLWTP